MNDVYDVCELVNVDDGQVVAPFDMDAVMDRLVDGAEQEISTMSLKEIQAHTYTEATRELIIRHGDSRLNSFDISAREMANRIAQDVAGCHTLISLDEQADKARDNGVYRECARDISEADRRITSHIREGVRMINGRAQELVWSPGYYRRMYKLGYREVK